MKVLYITVPSFFDLEISLIRELSKYIDLNVLLILQPESLHSSAFSLEKIGGKPCIMPSKDYEGMKKYCNLIDLNIWDVAVNPNNSFLSCLKLSSKIKQYIKKGNYDVIHCTSSCKTLLFLSRYLRRIKNTFLTIHDPIPHEKRGIFREFINNIYLNSYNNYVILNEQFKELVIKKFPQKSIFISSLSIYDYLTSYKDFNIDVDGQYILFIGRITYYKGVDILVKAYNLSDAPKNNIKLVIAGNGFVDGINESDITENILLKNRYIENEELSSLIKNCKFGILPYRSATQSGVLMSFYAFSKPVIATTVGNFSDYVNDGINGCICKEDDISALVESINRMLNLDITKFSENIKYEYTYKGSKSWALIANDIVNFYTKTL